MYPLFWIEKVMQTTREISGGLGNLLWLLVFTSLLSVVCRRIPNKEKLKEYVDTQSANIFDCSSSQFKLIQQISSENLFTVVFCYLSLRGFSSVPSMAKFDARNADLSFLWPPVFGCSFC